MVSKLKKELAATLVSAAICGALFMVLLTLILFQQWILLAPVLLVIFWVHRVCEKKIRVIRGEEQESEGSPVKSDLKELGVLILAGLIVSATIFSSLFALELTRWEIIILALVAVTVGVDEGVRRYFKRRQQK